MKRLVTPNKHSEEIKNRYRYRYRNRNRRVKCSRYAPPLSPISFIFMQFSAKILPNNRFLPQTQGFTPMIRNRNLTMEISLKTLLRCLYCALSMAKGLNTSNSISISSVNTTTAASISGGSGIFQGCTNHLFSQNFAKT